MIRVAQFGIVVGALGAVLTLMGLFPGMTGLEPTTGFGIIQIFTILIGFTLLIIGALIYAKFTFYPYQSANLAQQIGIRLAMTGILFAGMAGMADVLGFGSHLVSETDILLGRLQALGIIGGFGTSSLGVLLYAVTGIPNDGLPPEDLKSTEIQKE
jgi:hypothetical protein